MTNNKNTAIMAPANFVQTVAPEKEETEMLRATEKNTALYCRLSKEEKYKCICEEFRAQLADPDFEGYCHCMLFYKEKDS